MKAFRSIAENKNHLALSLLLGVLSAWLMRSEMSLLLLGKDFAGRSLPVQAGFSAAASMAAALAWAVFFHIYGDPLAQRLKAAPGWLQAHPHITLVLFLSFVARFFLAGWNSYWYDELVSVKLLAADRSDLLDVFRTMITGDRHPPLYQMVLYTWIRIFGSSELATRMLSTLYITLATFFLYLFTENVFGKRPALAASLFFNLSNIAIFYSLESRNFAQASFLSVLSAYVLLGYLRSVASDHSWKVWLQNRWFGIAVGVNLALLMTMYYNAFVLLAQAVFMLIYLFSSARRQNPVAAALKTAAYFLPPLILFIALWGQAILILFADTGSGLEAVVQPTPGLPVLFNEYVIRPNFRQPAAGLAILLLALLAMPGLYLREANPEHKNREEPLWRLFSLCWAFLPLVFAWLSFFIVRPPYLYARYFIFCTPPLMLLVVLGLEQTILWMDRLASHITQKSIWTHYTRYSLLYALAAVTVMVLPRGLDAAITQKQDWRGTAMRLAAMIQNDPGQSYAIIETSHRDTPLLDFYLQGYSPPLQVSGVLKVSEERSLESGQITHPAFMQSPTLTQYDNLVVTYIHFRQSAFPQAASLLEVAYPVRLRMLDSEGRGYVVYNLKAAVK